MKTMLYLLVVLSFVSCDKNATAPVDEVVVYRFTDTIAVDGRIRNYLMNLPPNYNTADNFALVVALHGFGGQPAQMEQDYKLTQKSNSAQFVVVYPEGTPSNGPLKLRSWNAGNCCDFAMESAVNDVGFISKLIQKLVRQYKISGKKVYVTGMSNGAMMTYRLACEIPNQIAAIAPVSGTLITSVPCQPARAVPVLHIHSEIDTKVPYAGGIGLAGYYFPPVDSSLRVWASINGCNLHPQTVFDSALYSQIRYNGCVNSTTVQLNLTKDGGHSWPGGLPARANADEPSKAFDATDEMWEFFKQYELP